MGARPRSPGQGDKPNKGESIMEVTVIGAGLAGSECAWQLAQRGVHVTLWEMKPQ